jgi:hypothetical protein
LNHVFHLAFQDPVELWTVPAPAPESRPCPCALTDRTIRVGLFLSLTVALSPEFHPDVGSGSRSSSVDIAVFKGRLKSPSRLHP